MKRLVATLAGGASLFAATSASALEFGTPAVEHPHRSSQNFALEIRFSPYKPQVDEEPALGGKTPFKDNFGTTPRVMIAAEFDWQAFRIPYVGTIGPGIGVGYTTMGADSLTVSGRESGDTTRLEIFPFWAVAVLRVDTFWRRAGIPLVPYGKAGLGYALWNASNTGGTSEVNGVKGKGKSIGTEFSLGLAFALDALDQGASRNMDNATGINGTYIFAEAYWLTLNGFGSDNTLRVGTNSWAAGLAFEF